MTDFLERNWINVVTGIAVLTLMIGFVITEIARIPRSNEFNIIVLSTWSGFLGIQVPTQINRFRNGNSQASH